MCPADVLAGWALPSSALRFFADFMLLLVMVLVLF